MDRAYVEYLMKLVEKYLSSLSDLDPGMKLKIKKSLAIELVSVPALPKINTHIPAEVVDRLESIGYDEYTADTILSLISLPEHSTTSWWSNYNFAKCLGDGRGWTVSIFGACSGTGDLLMILEELQKINPNHKLCKYIHPMKKTIGDDITGLETLGKDIIYMENDTEWQRAVWIIYIKLYWSFANDFSSKSKSCEKRPGPVLTLPVTRGFIVDTVINHGADLLSLTPILRKMRNKSETNEIKWTLDFCEARKQLLKAGYQSLDTSGTGGRCNLWSDIIKMGNFTLNRPIECHSGYWGKYRKIE